MSDEVSVGGPDIVVIGPGRLGTALARALHALGRWRVHVRARDAAGAPRASHGLPDMSVDHWDEPVTAAVAPTVVVAVPDRTIADVAIRLVPELNGAPVVLHTSGLLSSDVLGPCQREGAQTGSWHPLQTFTGAGVSSDHWTGVACAVEGDDGAVERAFELSHALRMTAWIIEADAKPTYHAAAAVAGNLTHLLVAGARDAMMECGLPDARALWPLVRDSTRSALEHQGLDGLSGALARGDVDAVRRHLEVLPPALRSAYRALAEQLRPEDATDWLD